MRKIYLDSEFKCHVTNVDGTLREIETNIFDGKCDEYIEGSRLVPFNETWVREDGEEFEGEMMSLWKDSSYLEEVQMTYASDRLSEYEQALAIMGVVFE